MSVPRVPGALWAGAAALVLAAGVWASAKSSGPQVQRVAGSPRATLPHFGRPLVRPVPAPGSPARKAVVGGYWLRSAPTDHLDRLARAAAELHARYGVVGQVQTGWRVRGYAVTAGPVRMRRAGEERCAVLARAGLVCQLREQPEGGYLLDFGTFPDSAAAQRVARAVRARGYTASVTPVRTPAYTLVVGPVPERAALALARAFRETGLLFSLSNRP